MSSLCYGIDVGTMNIVSATELENPPQPNIINFSSLRNVFLTIDKNELGNLDLSNISHFIIDDTIYIISNDAFSLSNIFNKPLRRPMSNGLISPNELDAVDVIGNMFKMLVLTNNSIDNIKNNNSICVYSCPAESIDVDNNVVYHREILKRILSSLGFSKIEPINEALAIVYSNCKDNGFSGIAISYGAGMTNIAVVYKAVPVLTFSLNMGGDWIDQKSSAASGIISSKATLIKETKLNLTDPFSNIGNKREKRIIEALVFYYNELINYSVKSIHDKLNEMSDVSLPDSLPIIISGGTSLAAGFVDSIKSHISQFAFPFNISEVKRAADPLTAVAEGCLIKAKLSSS
jgi:hypothetical protein